MSLSFVPGERLHVAEGSETDLSGAIQATFPPDTEVLALHVLDADTWYLIAVTQLAALQQRLLGRPGHIAAHGERAAAESLLDAPGLQLAAPQHGDLGVQPPTPAVLIDGEAVVGAWYEAGGDVGAGPAFDVEEMAKNGANELEIANGVGGYSAGGEPLITRTPHMDAPAELPAEAGAQFHVRVYTDTAAMRPEEEGEGIVIEAPPDVDEVELGVLLTTSPGLEVVGAFYQALVIHRDRTDGEGVNFTVAAGPEARKGEAGLIAQFVHRGRPSGRVARRWADGKAHALGETADATAVHVAATAPDLTLIVSAPVNDGIHYEIMVVAPGVPGFETPQKAPWALPSTADAFLKQTLAGFVDRTQPPDQRRSALVGAGLQFFGATPKLFQDALWALIDRHTAGPADAPVPTIFIASDEPLLPWELMIPTRQKDGIADDRPLPLGVEFAVGRWIRSDTTPPPQRLVVDDSFLIAATNRNKDRELDSSREREVLERHYAGRAVTPATLENLNTYLGANAATLLHFVCHGSAEAFDDAVFLDDDERCTSTQIRITQGFKTVCATRRPLIFLNACDAARTAPVLGGGAGFPRAFTDLGARAVIAPLWPVAQVVAAEVAVHLYEGALAHPERTLADLLRDVRQRAYEGDVAKFEDSYASYCFFGDPCTRLERSAGG